MLVLAIRPIMWMSVLGAIALGSGTAFAQSYPTKPIRIVTSGVGGLPDRVARVVGPEISEPLGQPVIVDNRLNTVLQAQIVAKAPSDGYTLLITSGAFVSAPLLQNSPFDLLKDFAPITEVVNAASFLVVHPGVPAKSVKELIALAKARPGELNYSSGGAGGATQLAVELFNSMAGINIVRIPYASGSGDIADLVAGRVQLTFSSFGAVGPFIKSGKLRALAVSSTEPSSVVPELPTVAATLPGFEFSNAIGVAAPAKTPDALITLLNREIVRAVTKPDIKQKFLGFGLEVTATSPQQFVAKIKTQTAQWAKVIKDAGIKAD